MKSVIAALALALLLGCEPPNKTPPTNMKMNVSGRVQITLLNQFKDDLAYGDTRGIYLIRDTETNQEFIGVSGIGITEVGSHKSGKHSRSEDER